MTGAGPAFVFATDRAIPTGAEDVLELALMLPPQPAPRERLVRQPWRIMLAATAESRLHAIWVLAADGRCQRFTAEDLGLGETPVPAPLPIRSMQPVDAGFSGNSSEGQR